MPIDEESAARRLATAKARVILAEAGDNPTEFTAALVARDRAEEAYVQAVNS
jgi:choline dehydrogenase-like flavoprotein